jgi:hypothetical protein
MALFSLPRRGKSAAQQGWLLGHQSIIRDMDDRVPQYLDDVDLGKLIYPACKREPKDVGGEVRLVWDHIRLEAMRYLVAVPAHGFHLLAEPARQIEILDAFLRQRPHEDVVIDFTGNTNSDLAIAAIAGFNWLNHCALMVGANRDRFTGTLRHFRKVVVTVQQWWEMEGAEERCGQMLREQETPPLMIFLVWLEYTRLAKEVVYASLSRLPTEPEDALVERTELMLHLATARDPKDLP